MSRLAQVAPPSKLTAANNPASGTTTLETTTMLLGLVGLTATATSDSLVGRRLTSTLPGGRAAATPAPAAAEPGATSPTPISIENTTTDARATRIRSLPSASRSFQPAARRRGPGPAAPQTLRLSSPAARPALPPGRTGRRAAGRAAHDRDARRHPVHRQVRDPEHLRRP